MRRSTMVAIAICACVSPALALDGLPPDFVDAATIVPGLQTDIRYAGAHNFTGAPVDGYGAPRCWLTRAAAEALAKVQADLAPKGLRLKVFDCYRPARAVRRFVEWSKASGAARGKAEFFPDVPKGELFARGYIAERSAHSRGSTVDLTLLDAKTGAALDMGTPFDLFGPASHPDFPRLPDRARANRAVLRSAMLARGFAPYDKEWWHFTLKGEPYPTRAFDVPIR